MNVDELEEKINSEKALLATLEDSYEKETDEAKQVKIEYKIARKDESINHLIDRQNTLLDKEDAKGTDDTDKEAEEKKDEDVCEECGGDLILVGTDEKTGKDIYECELCGGLYLDE
jgi:uncharacterized protein with PIN domain